MSDVGAKKIRGVLLDIDGTLLDSNLAHARAWVDALRGEGFSFDVEMLRTRIGKGGDKILKELCNIDDESEKGKSISDKRGRIFLDTYLQDLKPQPGARELIQLFQRAGLACIVATSATEKELAAILTAATVKDLIDDGATSSDADKSKPDPDIVVAAIKRSKLSASELLLLGDTPFDMQAARRAGVGFVGVTCGGWNLDDLRDAVAVYKDPADIVAHFGSSPFAG